MATLGHSIQQFELDPIEGTIPLLDRSTTNVLMTKLKSSDPSEILHALDLFEMGHHAQVYTAVRDLLDHPASEIRAKAVSILSAAEDLAVRPHVLTLLHDESLEVRTEALSYLSRNDHIDPLGLIEELGKFADSSICSAAIAFLARPGEAQNLVAARFMLEAMINETGPEALSSRRAAAQLVGILPDQFEQQLGKLLEDSDTEVVRHAIRAVGKFQKASCVTSVASRLIDPSLAFDAVDTLASFKDSIIGSLVNQLCDGNSPIQLRREIPGVLLRIGTVEAAKALADNLLQVDSVLRYRITVALNKLVELHRSLPLDRDFIETVMVAEIMGHYRSYQIFAMLRGHGDRLLKDSIDREVERIFRLMKVLYPSVDLENAYRGIQSRDRVAHANALEFLENTLSPSLRTLLIPVIDGEVSPAERMRLADRFLNTKLASKEEAVAVLVHTEDPWLKSCAAYAIKKLGMLAFQPDLDRWAQDPDPLLRRRIAEVQALP